MHKSNSVEIQYYKNISGKQVTKIKKEMRRSQQNRSEPIYNCYNYNVYLDISLRMNGFSFLNLIIFPFDSTGK